MAGIKKLINRTGNDLTVILAVRKGDHPSETAGTVEVYLAAGTTGDKNLDEQPSENGSVQEVTYGNDTDVYLNGIEAKMSLQGAALATRQLIVQRGTGLDNALNTNDTIEFLFDGQTILISATNSDTKAFHFAAAPK